ncbi:hypothetical protein DITRI_Ditri11bG0084300 [Diplodiscus trichospermus]
MFCFSLGESLAGSMKSKERNSGFGGQSVALSLVLLSHVEEEHTVAASISIAAQATHYPLFIHFYGSSMDEVFDALAKCILPTSAIAANPKVSSRSSIFSCFSTAPPYGTPACIAGDSSNCIQCLEVIQAYCRFSWPYSQFKPPKVAIVIPMGGFHLYRSQLDAMENPEEAHARRGAPWTFDPMLLLNCLKNLRNQGSVYAPSLDHGVGDPIEDDIFVSLQFIDVDLDTAMQRVLKRHISTGNGYFVIFKQALC